MTIQSPQTGPAFNEAAEEALAIFKTVDMTCTRFQAGSPLVRANERPGRWHRAPRLLLEAVREAHAAYLATGGMFDPRVLDVLLRLGYDKSFALGPGWARPVAPSRQPARRWSPRFVGPVRLVNFGGARLDLGGIGKGLAIRWAADRLRAAGRDFLVDGGGDVFASGQPETGNRWRIGVESPNSADGDHIAVLSIRDEAVATSSTRIRTWQAGNRSVHHLIDPRTSQPGGGQLRSVTVVHPDPAWAEVWSKVVFLAGPRGAGRRAEEEGLPALWVDAQGVLRCSPAMDPYLVWVAR